MNMTHYLKNTALAAALCCTIFAVGGLQAQAKTLTGIDSSVGVQATGEWKQDSMDVFVKVDKELKKFVIGEQFSKTEGEHFSVYVYSLSLKTKEYEAASGKTVESVMPQSVASYEESLIHYLGGHQLSTVKEETTIFKKPVYIDTVNFSANGQRMTARVIYLLNKDDYWMITPVYETDNKAAAQQADEFVKTLELY